MTIQSIALWTQDKLIFRHTSPAHISFATLVVIDKILTDVLYTVLPIRGLPSVHLLLKICVTAWKTTGPRSTCFKQMKQKTFLIVGWDPRRMIIESDRPRFYFGMSHIAILRVPHYAVGIRNKIDPGHIRNTQVGISRDENVANVNVF